MSNRQKPVTEVRTLFKKWYSTWFQSTQSHWAKRRTYKINCIATVANAYPESFMTLPKPKVRFAFLQFVMQGKLFYLFSFAISRVHELFSSE